MSESDYYDVDFFQGIIQISHFDFYSCGKAYVLVQHSNFGFGKRLIFGQEFHRKQ